MIDTHCHVDLYSHPTEVASRANREGVLTVIVTNLPSAFEKAYPHIQNFRNIRLALGLHPLTARDHASERELFAALVDRTSFIGEIGLDFSRDGYSTRDEQVSSFEFVLRAIQEKPKFITIHSRRAESTVIELLKAATCSPVVFHWYTGPLGTLHSALNDGHYLSINPAMIQSPHGQKVIAQLPRDRVLTETDGPFVQVRGRPAEPKDVLLVEKYLAKHWGQDEATVRQQIRDNFMRIVAPIKSVNR